MAEQVWQGRCGAGGSGQCESSPAADMTTSVSLCRAVLCLEDPKPRVLRQAWRLPGWGALVRRALCRNVKPTLGPNFSHVFSAYALPSKWSRRPRPGMSFTEWAQAGRRGECRGRAVGDGMQQDPVGRAGTWSTALHCPDQARSGVTDAARTAAGFHALGNGGIARQRLFRGAGMGGL